MKNFKFAFALFFSLSSMNLFAHETPKDFHRDQISATYISYEDLLFENGRIFLICSDQVKEINAVFSDNHGLYIIEFFYSKEAREDKILDFCSNGHPVYHQYYYGGCGGCAHPWCVFRCKCHMPWN
jgi:hypothetical protein